MAELKLLLRQLTVHRDQFKSGCRHLNLDVNIIAVIYLAKRIALTILSTEDIQGKVGITMLRDSDSVAPQLQEKNISEFISYNQVNWLSTRVPEFKELTQVDDFMASIKMDFVLTSDNDEALWAHLLENKAEFESLIRETVAETSEGLVVIDILYERGSFHIIPIIHGFLTAHSALLTALGGLAVSFLANYEKVKMGAKKLGKDIATFVQNSIRAAERLKAKIMEFFLRGKGKQFRRGYAT